MAYQVLARKWRPKTFAQLVGQEHVIKALANAFASERLHHAYLLTGTRGVGKTTIARIMAKALNCETGITSTPCGVCSACTQIDAGRFVDLLEIDAASNTGIDNIREVLDNAQYSPTAGRFKVYIIDEVHMLSKSAFNAMLKTLEEPPSHVKFILATTDPQKVPITVLSRCLQFSLRQMTPQQVTGHLHKVLEAEQVQFEPLALNLLGHAANGSMRDALSLLDQAIAHGAGQVEESGVRAMLGAVDQSYLFDLLDALAAHDGPRLLHTADAIASRGLSYEAALHELANVLHQVALTQAVPNALADDLPQRGQIVAAAQALSPEDTQLYYQIALHGRRDLPLAPDEYAGFTMTLLRMLAFAPAKPEQIAGAVTPAKPEQITGTTTPAKTEQNSGVIAPPANSAQALSNIAPAQAEQITATPAASTSPAGAITPGKPEQIAASPARLESASVVQMAPSATEPAPAPAQPSNTAPAVESASAYDDLEPPPWHSEAAEAIYQASEPAAQYVSEPAPTAPHTEPAPSIATPSQSKPVTPFNGDWRALVVQLKLGAAGMLAQNAELLSYSDIRFDLQVAEAHRAVATRDYQDKLRLALSEHFGRDIEVNVNIGTIQGETPAVMLVRENAARQEVAVAAIQNDPFIQTLVRDFGGTIDAASIKPL
ncbi:DNA polymerase III subunit gamma/tau [Chitinibacter bivalviorum]|uniref:DNA polymerase III subunit gamma/tau n=1 Tax=Chitinibacter bivalviorum TaxID=2739434 RepID=A0A7H9BJP5_9NEIS|nr:DNA polymerase III subunit gamma/tau [Chitinibacter bivalviorum]QLG88241.1 DNA polymerase III subunit gamma/tau [Chitinibacter bivalviorum]